MLSSKRISTRKSAVQEDWPAADLNDRGVHFGRLPHAAFRSWFDNPILPPTGRNS
jgi:hypothetical protein